MEKIVRIGGVELREEEAKNIFEDRLYVVSHNTIYQIVRGKNGYRGSIAYRHHGSVPLTKRGRYFVADGSMCDRLVGVKDRF